VQISTVPRAIDMALGLIDFSGAVWA